MRRRLVARRALTFALLAILPVIAGAAARHLKLIRSEPLANAVLTMSPTQVKLWFTQRPELTVTSIKVSRKG